LFCALACDGALDGVRLLRESTVAYARREAWNQTDVFGIPSRMSNGGFMLCNKAFTTYNSNPRSFGHIGLGGAIAFGDPDAKLSFSFCGNRMAPIADIVPYAKRLLQATDSSV
jgi:CubicO group peptidase (beta-lactamase class C family)